MTNYCCICSLICSLSWTLSRSHVKTGADWVMFIFNSKLCLQGSGMIFLLSDFITFRGVGIIFLTVAIHWWVECESLLYVDVVCSSGFIYINVFKHLKLGIRLGSHNALIKNDYVCLDKRFEKLMGFEWKLDKAVYIKRRTILSVRFRTPFMLVLKPRTFWFWL